MAYKAVHIILEPFVQEHCEILFALLGAYNFEGIYEKENGIETFITTENYSGESLQEIQASLLALGCRMVWKVEDIADQNWNALWESNFDPVIIDTRCAIRAPFHPEFKEVRYQITIEPKMAFGTGHHPTTRLVIEQMLGLEFNKKRVLDMGCGTGILGILASMMGAAEVISIDIDEWAFRNTQENVVVNGVHNLRVIQGDSNAIPEGSFNIILANINLNTLKLQIADYARHTQQGSLIILSGFLEEDVDIINQTALEEQFQLLKSDSLDKWIVMLFERN